MLVRRTRTGDRERLLIDDSQAVLVVERDHDGARVLSWNDRRDELRPTPLIAMGRSCSASCRGAGSAAGPVSVDLTVNGHREDVHWWSGVLRAMAMRPEVCSRCSLLTRWAGGHWCGRPWPVRAWGWITRWIRPAATRANVGGQAVGCGCLLNLKWRSLITPGSMLRRTVAAIAWIVCGEEWEVHEQEAACPFGLWPSAL